MKGTPVTQIGALGIRVPRTAAMSATDAIAAAETAEHARACFILDDAGAAVPTIARAARGSAIPVHVVTRDHGQPTQAAGRMLSTKVRTPKSARGLMQCLRLARGPNEGDPADETVTANVTEAVSTNERGWAAIEAESETSDKAEVAWLPYVAVPGTSDDILPTCKAIACLRAALKDEPAERHLAEVIRNPPILWHRDDLLKPGDRTEGTWARTEEFLGASLDLRELRLADLLGTDDDAMSGRDDDLAWLQRTATERLNATRGTDPTYRKRLAIELEAIERTGFAKYYRVAARLTDHAREHGQLLGPGRGSAAGSLVAQLLGITEPDPIAADLMFERFIDVNRITPPDFDIDVEPRHQSTLQGVLRELWGPERSRAMAAYPSFSERSATQLAVRAYGMPQPIAIRVAERVERAMRSGAPLSTAIAGEPTAERERLAEAIAGVPKMLGTTNAVSQHPAAIALFPKELETEDGPRIGATADAPDRISWDGPDLEAEGVAKIDVLANANIAMIAECVRTVGDGTGTVLDPWNLPADPRVFEALAGGDTTGIFQLGSDDFAESAAYLQPKDLPDLAALISFLRPGTRRQFDLYVRRAHGNEATAYADDRLEPILKETHGVILYQEQAMRTAMVLAGFTATEADELRRAIGKKDPRRLPAIEDRFRTGCAQATPAVERATAENVWNVLAEHAGYSFNRPHAWCYAIIAYATAYLRYHYPTAFYAALATREWRATETNPDFDRVALSAAAQGIRWRPPRMDQPGPAFEPAAEPTEPGVVTPLQSVMSLATARLWQGQAIPMDRRDYEERMTTLSKTAAAQTRRAEAAGTTRCWPDDGADRQPDGPQAIDATAYEAIEPGASYAVRCAMANATDLGAVVRTVEKAKRRSDGVDATRDEAAANTRHATVIALMGEPVPAKSSKRFSTVEHYIYAPGARAQVRMAQNQVKALPMGSLFIGLLSITPRGLGLISASRVTEKAMPTGSPDDDGRAAWTVTWSNGASFRLEAAGLTRDDASGDQAMLIGPVAAGETAPEVRLTRLPTSATVPTETLLRTIAPNATHLRTREYWTTPSTEDEDRDASSDNAQTEPRGGRRNTARGTARHRKSQNERTGV